MWQLVILLVYLTQTIRCEMYNQYNAVSPTQFRYLVDSKHSDQDFETKPTDHVYKRIPIPDKRGKIDMLENEKSRSIFKVVRANQYDFSGEVKPKRVDAFTGNKHKIVPVVLSRYNKYEIEPRPVRLYRYDPAAKKESIRWQKEQAVKASRLSISRYNKEFNAFQHFLGSKKDTLKSRSEKKRRHPHPARYQPKRKRLAAKRTVGYSIIHNISDG